MISTKEEPVAMDNRRAELNRVLHSDLFTRAPVLGHLLSYLCEKTLAGEINEIKEYSIAIDVFGRDPSFDQDSDSIVRVHANRLRKRLAEYYEKQGTADPIHISIPVGQYVPLFEERAVPSLPESAQDTVQPAAAPIVSEKLLKRKRVWVGVVSVLVVILAASGLLIFRSSRTSPAPSSNNVQSVPDLPVGLPAGDEVRILAGAKHAYVDRSGKMWNADAYFTGGSSVKSAVQMVWRTQESFLYRFSREGNFSYDIPMNPGVYEMRLHFAETYYGPDEDAGGGEGSRLMNVSLNGKPILANFDVMADAGASRTSDVKIFTDVSPASDGKIHLKFDSAYGGQAMVSAVEILPGIRGHIRPIRIATRTSPYYSIDSRWWSPDNYYKGGQLAESREPALDTDDPELYQAERWGNFSYAIPAPPGKYNLVLHFIERRLGPNKGRAISTSQTADAQLLGRKFNVFCNGKVLLRELDLLKQAGENRPYVRSFSGIEPNAQGKLVLEFTPIQDYATVSAIEVIPQ